MVSLSTFWRLELGRSGWWFQVKYLADYLAEAVLDATPSGVSLIFFHCVLSGREVSSVHCK